VSPENLDPEGGLIDKVEVASRASFIVCKHLTGWNVCWLVTCTTFGVVCIYLPK
jgi:hypothetical protein